MRHQPTHPKTCAICSITFHAHRYHAKTCSPRCRQKLSRLHRPPTSKRHQTGA